MYTRSVADTAPRALLSQARAAVAAAAAARRYLDEPGPEALEQAVQARLAARKARGPADAELEAAKGPKGDWLALSAALADLADEAGCAVEEHGRFGAQLGQAGRELGRLLQAAAERLAAALERPGEAEETLAEAKSKALQMEDMRRRARQAALNQPRLAAELSAQAVLDRLSRAAECVHRAADALGAGFGGRA
jgi:hypothetical protein